MNGTDYCVNASSVNMFNNLIDKHFIRASQSYMYVCMHACMHIYIYIYILYMYTELLDS